jgi:hypothetical protein
MRDAFPRLTAAPPACASCGFIRTSALPTASSRWTGRPGRSAIHPTRSPIRTLPAVRSALPAVDHSLPTIRSALPRFSDALPAGSARRSAVRKHLSTGTFTLATGKRTRATGRRSGRFWQAFPRLRSRVISQQPKGTVPGTVPQSSDRGPFSRRSCAVRREKTTSERFRTISCAQRRRRF